MCDTVCMSVSAAWLLLKASEPNVRSASVALIWDYIRITLLLYTNAAPVHLCVCVFVCEHENKLMHTQGSETETVRIDVCTYITSEDNLKWHFHVFISMSRQTSQQVSNCLGKFAVVELFVARLYSWLQNTARPFLHIKTLWMHVWLMNERDWSMS